MGVEPLRNGVKQAPRLVMGHVAAWLVEKQKSRRGNKRRRQLRLHRLSENRLALG
jgi:hypothetical protein